MSDMYKWLEINVYDKSGNELDYESWDHEKVAAALEDHANLCRLNGKLIEESDGES